MRTKEKSWLQEGAHLIYILEQYHSNSGDNEIGTSLHDYLCSRYGIGIFLTGFMNNADANSFEYDIFTIFSIHKMKKRKQKIFLFIFVVKNLDYFYMLIFVLRGWIIWLLCVIKMGKQQNFLLFLLIFILPTCLTLSNIKLCDNVYCLLPTLWMIRAENMSMSSNLMIVFIIFSFTRSDIPRPSRFLTMFNCVFFEGFYKSSSFKRSLSGVL